MKYIPEIVFNLFSLLEKGHCKIAGKGIKCFDGEKGSEKSINCKYSDLCMKHTGDGKTNLDANTAATNFRCYTKSKAKQYMKVSNYDGCFKDVTVGDKGKGSIKTSACICTTDYCNPASTKSIIQIFLMITSSYFVKIVFT